MSLEYLLASRAASKELPKNSNRASSDQFEDRLALIVVK